MSPKQSILIVDDNPVHLELYRMVVEQGGFKGVPVLVSYSGMQLPADERVDAVLLDYRLGPHMTGFDAVKKVRDRYPAVPILIQADAYDLPSDIQPFVQGLVRKGSPDELLSALRGVLKSEN